MTSTGYSLQRAMMLLDKDMPVSVQIAGDVSSRFLMGVCAILTAEQLLHVIIGLL
jgi:hypothetical protein